MGLTKPHPLHWVESASYCSLMLAVSVLLFWHVYSASVEYEKDLLPQDISSGWSIINRKQDQSNFEWIFWREWFFKCYYIFIIYTVFADVTKRLLSLKSSIYAQGAFSMALVCYVYNVQPFIYYLTYVVIMYVTSLTRSKALCWAVGVVMFLILQYTPCQRVMYDISDYLNHYYLLLFTIAMAVMRSISYALDSCDGGESVVIEHVTNNTANMDITNSTTTTTKTSTSIRNRKQTRRVNRSFSDNETDCHDHQNEKQEVIQVEFGFLHMLCYVFYLPTFLNGPMINYNEYYVERYSSQKPITCASLWVLLKSMSRVIVWALVLEVLQHYCYTDALVRSEQALYAMGLWALAGLGHLQGHFFHIKYVVMFGYGRALAALDGVHAPEGPKCVQWIYLYGDMWKYFDRGMYLFMRKYIYFYLGGSRRGLLRQVAASFLCFLFVYVWHGEEMNILYWTMFSFVGVTLEQVLKHNMPALYTRYQIAPPWPRRIEAVLCVPLLAMSFLSVFAYFGGMLFFHAWVNRIIFQGFCAGQLVALVVGYLYIQTGMEVEWYLHKTQ